MTERTFMRILFGIAFLFLIVMGGYLGYDASQTRYCIQGYQYTRDSSGGFNPVKSRFRGHYRCESNQVLN